MAHIRKFGSFMEEYRFMVKQNYYHLLKEAYLRNPNRPTIQIALRRAKLCLFGAIHYKAMNIGEQSIVSTVEITIIDYHSIVCNSTIEYQLIY